MVMRGIPKRMLIAEMLLLSFRFLQYSMLTDKNHLLSLSAGGINDKYLIVLRNFVFKYFINLCYVVISQFHS